MTCKEEHGGFMMNVILAKRMDAFQKSIFSELAQLKHAKIQEGNEVVDLSIGSPDLSPPPFIMEELVNQANQQDAYGYSLAGTKSFHQAVSHYYHHNYDVHIDGDSEILLLMGSQDGLVHLPMALCNPRDYVLTPDPGYTAYATGISMAGANIYPMPITEDNHFLPDFDAIPLHVCHQAKLMILNYPGNPVPALATIDFYQKAIAFAKKYNIVILHDFAYSELYFEEKPISFLSVDGAREVGIEMNSLSKSFNMAGCRIAYAAGNSDVIYALSQLKSNLDYGVFKPIQAAAVKALTDESDFLHNIRSIYKQRRDILIDGFHRLGWHVEAPKASMFIWARIPEGFTSKEFTLALLHKANVVVTPGNAFGENGEGYVRMALVQSEETLRKAIANIEKSGIFK